MSETPSNTLNDPHSGSVTSVTFDRAATYYDQTRGFPEGVEAGVAETFRRAGNLNAESRVLEIGVGTGRIALLLASEVNVYYGVDLSRPMLERLKSKPGAKRVACTEGDATRLPYPDGAFDAVIAVHVFHLIPQWQTVLHEAARVLRPGGLLLHGGDNGMERRSSLKMLLEAWESAVRPAPEKTWAVPLKRDSFLEDSGWTQQGEAQRHEFRFMRAPQVIYDQLARRVWSSTWALDDASVERGLRAVQAAIDTHFGDGAVPVEVGAAFETRAYRPPSIPG